MTRNALFSRRRAALRSALAAKRLRHLLVTDAASWYYLTGFTGEAGALIVSRSGTALITDGRFTVQAKEETAGIRIVGQRAGLFAAAGELLKAAGRGACGFDASRITVAQLQDLRKSAGPRVRWTPAGDCVEPLRRRKGAEELAQMRRAAILAGEVAESAIRMLKPGVRECEVAAEIEYLMRSGGASGPAFETIVASGPRGAFPHARPTSKRLRKNELVVLDLGVILAHYCSDITRTVVVGRASARVRRWYRAVQEAQSAAIDAIHPGVRCGDVDAAARQVLTSYQLESFFVHSTGHGLGLQVHEEPRIAKGQEQRLEPGNVVTVEPGVYVPGVGGIRIEDDVAVLEKGREVLTRIARDLIEI